MRIYIRSTNWIGDAVMSVAALRELRRLYRGHYLALAAKPWVAGLFENQGLVDSILVVDEESGRLRSFKQGVAAARGHDRAILFQNAFRAALTACTAGVPERIGYATDGRRLLLTRSARPRIRQLKRHQIYYYLDLLFQTGLSPHDYLNEPGFEPDIHLNPPLAGLEAARQLLERTGVESGRPLIALNPGAFFGSAKRWFVDRYAALADLLTRKQGAQILILGSAGENGIAEAVEKLMHHSPVDLTGATDLAALMAVISMCDLFVTNDSGPMHLAAALGTPLIALFGSTDEIATGPFSAAAHVIHKHVECSPCLLRECPLDLRCFKSIEVEEVYDLAVQVLHGK